MIANKEGKESVVTINAETHDTSLIPAEFREPNWRIWSFILVVILAIYLLTQFPVRETDGLIDPFYSPTVLVLPIVGLFRLTCYAYRKDYHRHIFSHPMACRADVRHENTKRKYNGETRFFRVENVHRYFMYASWPIIPFFFYDVYVSITYKGFAELSLGSIILLINAIFVTLYTFSCHSLRHVTAGGAECFGCVFNQSQPRSSARWGFFRFQSALNRHHEALAWTSLSLLIFVDLYIRALGVHMFPNIILIH
ncbi:hypothetical protein GCM10007108_09720 [Thermogymnomonas acidicola]|uniref:Integral membrane protein n=1 Tax=Thermogymnomonas acidicola TaxID=399579 RepID=A0AA37FAC9_9ARCH|nr:hypothetical protein [Thermogymnomonas acidicola]GGM73831.1 hypothetical protein GCM10007108_09720 [Thermogymnomonas acidicola]